MSYDPSAIAIRDTAIAIASEAGLHDELTASRKTMDAAWRMYAAARWRRDESAIVTQRRRDWQKARRSHEAILHRLAPTVRTYLGRVYLGASSRRYLYTSDAYMMMLGYEAPAW